MAKTSVSENLADVLALLVTSTCYDVKTSGETNNLYVLVVGASSITHKSTATHFALSMCPNVCPVGTASDFRKQMTNPRMWPRKLMLHDDEFSQTMKNMRSGTHGYKIMQDLLNSAYDGKVKFPGNNNLPPAVVDDVKVSFVGSTTIEHFKKYATPEFVEGGLMKRMLVVIPDRAPYRSRRSSTRMNIPQLQSRQMTNDMEMTQEAWDLHDEFMERAYSMENSIAGTWARAESHVLKIAAMYAMSSWLWEIDAGCWRRAKEIVESSVNAQQVLKTLV